MAASGNNAGGWTDSLGRISDSLLALLHTRFELFAVELQEEKLRAVSLLGWLGVALALLLAGTLVALGALALFLWELAGYYGLFGFALAALLGSAVLLLLVRRRILRSPAPFSATLAEFDRDFKCLRGSK